MRSRRDGAGLILDGRVPVAAPFAGNAVLENNVHPDRGIGLKTFPQSLENISHRWAVGFPGAVTITCLGRESPAEGPAAIFRAGRLRAVGRALADSGSGTPKEREVMR